MKRKKHNARARFRRIMRGAGFKFDGKELTGVDRTGRPLTPIEAEAAKLGAWKWRVSVIVRGRLSDAVRTSELEFDVQQWTPPDELGQIIDQQAEALADDMPGAWQVEPVEWVAVITG